MPTATANDWRPPEADAWKPPEALQAGPTPAKPVKTGLAAPAEVKTPATPDWPKLYEGLEGIDQRVTANQSKAFSSLDPLTDNPKEARAKVINQSYLQTQLKGMDANAISANWQTVKDSYAKQSLGMDKKGVTDTELYSAIGQHLQGSAFMDSEEWKKGSPFDRFKLLMTTFPHQFGHAMHAVSSGKEAFDPLVKLPERKDAPNIPFLGLGNPALAAGVWNSAVKPVLEGVESPGGIATLGIGGALAGAAKAGAPLAKAGLVAMQGMFAAIMTHATIKNAPQSMKVLNDPNATLQEKIEAVGSTVTPAVMAASGALGVLAEVKPDIVAKLKANPAENAKILQEEAAKAPMEEIEHLTNAAREMEKVAPPPPSEAAQAWDEVKKVFNPASRGPKAEETAGALREHGGELAIRTDRAAAALESASKTLMKMTPEERLEVVNRIEEGRNQDSEPMNRFADTAREILDTKREEIQKLGTGKLEHFIEDYFPHIWKDPEAAASAFQKSIAKAPLEGSKSFLKKRTIPTTAEGIALGLEPASENPVELVLLKAREMDKYLLGQKWLAEMKEKDFVKFVKAGAKPPEGYEPINDKIATVYGKPSHPGAQQIEGAYYAPSEVATVANNYLSPGLRKYATFRAYLSAANSANQFQLGLSAFHLGFTSLDTSISKLALAFEYGAQGKGLKAAAKVAQIPTAPITNMLQGNRVLKEWLTPGSQGEEMAQIVDAIRMAGGRAKMDSFYQTTMTKRMQEMFSQGGFKGTVGGLWRAPLAALEQTSKPIMEYVVPRQKLGVAADLIRAENERMPPNATLEQKRAAYDKIWDSVDNRMGQMVYDNLFWNKVAKDLAMASVRSVGWNLGTLRELGGGAMDTAKYAKDLLTPKEKAEFTHRMGYTMALPMLTGVLGATYQYLKTGEGPQEMRDYFFPKTGEKDPQGRDVRLTIPTYMKDIYHYAHDPVGTVEGKVHPAISMTIQALNNKDFFGRDIRNSDDPVVQQLLSEAKFFGENLMPIGVRQFQQSQAAGVSKGEQAANFLGITRAPAWIGESSAEQLAGKLAGDKFKSSKAPDAKVVQDRKNIQTMLRNGDETQKAQAKAMLSEMVTSGEITQKQKQNLVRGVDHTYLENALSHLDAHEAMRVFKSATVEERQEIRDAVLKKIEHAHIPQEDRKTMREQLEKLLPERDPKTTLRQ